jgi:RsiW-degrading membrane proteinase PrsW (M82 family)
MLDIAAIVPAAIAPALLVLWLVVTADRRPEPPWVVWLAFVLGALSIFALRYVRMWLQPLLVGTDNPWLTLADYALFQVGIPEESLKVLIIAAIALRARVFDEPMDGVVCGAAVGLGFAANENLGYLVQYQDWETLAIVRGILTIPFHASLGAIAGTYLASARFGSALGAHRGEPLVRARLIMSAWLIPVVLHTLYDIPLLALRRGLDDGDIMRACLRAAGLLIGFGTIAVAVQVTLRIARFGRDNPGHRQGRGARFGACWWRAPALVLSAPR